MITFDWKTRDGCGSPLAGLGCGSGPLGLDVQLEVWFLSAAGLSRLPLSRLYAKKGPQQTFDLGDCSMLLLDSIPLPRIIETICCFSHATGSAEKGLVPYIQAMNEWMNEWMNVWMNEWASTQWRNQDASNIQTTPYQCRQTSALWHFVTFLK